MKLVRAIAAATVLLNLAGMTATYAQDAPPAPPAEQPGGPPEQPAPPPPPPEQPKPPQPPPAPPEQPQPPPPPPVQQISNIYVIVAGQQRGPLTLDQVIAEIKAGTITRDTLVWTPDQAGWIPAGQHPVIGQQFTAVAPPPTPPTTAAAATAAAATAASGRPVLL